MAGVAPHVTAIPLGRVSPRGSCDQPGRRGGNAPCLSQASLQQTSRPYSVLLPVGFALPRPLPAARCALTAPFHPCPGRIPGGSISVALSLGSPPPDVIRHRRCMEPGLSSAGPRGLTAAVRPAGGLTKSLSPALSSPGGPLCQCNHYSCLKVLGKLATRRSGFVQQSQALVCPRPSAHGPVR